MKPDKLGKPSIPTLDGSKAALSYINRGGFAILRKANQFPFTHRRVWRLFNHSILN